MPGPRASRPSTWAGAVRALLSITCVSLALGVVGALWSPGYRDPEPWGLPALQPVAPTGGCSDLPVTERVVQLTIRGGRADALLVSPPQPRSALVVVHGSGRGARADARDVMLALAGQGVAVLSADKVMAGYSFVRRDFVRLGDDAAEAAAWLQRELDLDPSQVGLLGRSEGGWVSLLAAARHPALSGPIVLDSAPVVTPLEQSAYVATGRGRGGWPLTRRLITGLLASGRPVVNYLDVDVRSALPSISNRVIAVFGASDNTVPVAQAVSRLQSGLPRSPEVVVAAGGHLPSPEGWAPAVARSLTAAARTGAVQTTAVGQAAPPGGGAPHPPPPSPVLDPRWHVGVAVLLLLILRLTRSRRRVPERPGP